MMIALVYPVFDYAPAPADVPVAVKLANEKLELYRSMFLKVSVEVRKGATLLRSVGDECGVPSVFRT